MYDLLSARSARGYLKVRTTCRALAMTALVAACHDPAEPVRPRLIEMPSLNFDASPDTMDLAFATPVAGQGQIAFASNRSGNFDIYVLDVATGRTHRLTRDKGGDNSPAWSPDGTKIAFSGARDGNTDIYVMSVGGSTVTRLTTGNNWDAEPTWSPDGKKIAFSSGAGLGGGDIWVRNADGAGPTTNLTNHAAYDASPAWSPDGAKIAFVSDRGSPPGTNQQNVFVMNADGTGVTQLTTGGGILPAWSPDGQRIAFTTFRDGDWEIYVANATGAGSPVNLTRDPDASDMAATWSPDGGRLAFTSHRDGRVDLYVMNADGSGVTRVARSSGDDQRPAWQP